MMSTSPLSTQVTDTARGCPADGMPVALERRAAHEWTHIGGAVTDERGYAEDLLGEQEELTPGTYRLTFDAGTYFAANAMQGLYPVIRVVFDVGQDGERYHLPLLLSPHGYSTFRAY